MQSILDAINEWIKGILIGAINGNLSTMFGDVNEKVGTIANEVGKTPQGWNANIFSMIQNLSENVIVPIAGLVITYPQCTLNAGSFPAERRFFIGVCTRTERLIQSQNKSRFQPDEAAAHLFCGSPGRRLAAFLFTQGQRRDKPCSYGYDCRHAAMLPLCHV